MGNTFKTGYLQNLIAYDVNGNITLPGTLTISNNKLVATQEYVTTQLSSLVGSAPGALDTLNELSAALNNDASFSTTITNSLAGKQNALSGTGFVKISGTTISYDNSTYLTTSSASSTYLPLAGGTLTGGLSGTTGSFSGQVTSSTSFYTAAISNTLGSRTFGGNSFSIRNNVAEDFNIDIYNRTSDVWYNALRLANNGGAATFASSITATSATFTGRVLAGNSMFLGEVISGFTTIESTSGNGIWLRPVGAASPTGLRMTTAGDSTFSSTVTAAGTIQSNEQNAFFLNQAGNTTDTKLWAIQNLVTSGTFRIRAINDAVTSGVNAIEISRSGISSVTTAFTGGNVGIGTDAPSSKLTVSRATESTAYQLELRNVGGISNNNYDGIRFTQGSQGLTPLGSIRLKYRSNGYPDFGIFTRNDSATETEKVTILNNGNLGIGTISPTQKLTIDGLRGQPATTGTTQNGLFRLSTLGIGYGEVLDMGVHVGVDGPSSYSWIQSTNQGNHSVNYNLTLNPNGGNVGVNTTSPLERLSVTGNLHVAGVGNGLMFDTDGSGRAISQYVANLYEFHILNARGNSSRFILGNGSISLGTSSIPLFFINTSSGNVGMGTTDFANLAFGSTLLKVAGTRATLGLQSSGTLSTIALISANNLNTAMHLNYESTGAFKWYNYTSASEIFTLLGNGKLGLGVSSPDARLHVGGGGILVSNNAQTFRRSITCHGQVGTYSEIKVIFNKTNWGSVTYDIKLASAGGTYHTAGCYYSNPGFSSNLVSINAGNGPAMALTAESPNGGSQGATWRFYGVSMIHPIVTVDIASGNGYQVNPDDIIVQFL